jgi:hypothetical protein
VAVSGKVTNDRFATRLDPLPTTFDHPTPDTTLHHFGCQY